MEILTLLQEPFMQRALLGGLVVAVLTATIGVFVTLRKESFIAHSVAHGSLAGVSLALLVSGNPTLLACIIAVLMAVAIVFLRKRASLSSDTSIGMLSSFMFAVGVLLINLQTTYKPALETFLFGSLLAISWQDVIISSVVATVILVIISKNYTKFLHITFDPESAQVRGLNVEHLEYLLAIIASISVVISVKVVGIILVSALLVVPAASAKLLSRKFADMIPISILHNLVAVMIGIFISTSTPPGVNIVIVSTALFGLIAIVTRLRRS
jgi:zinc transport system permease protein